MKEGILQLLSMKVVDSDNDLLDLCLTADGGGVASPK